MERITAAPAPTASSSTLRPSWTQEDNDDQKSIISPTENDTTAPSETPNFGKDFKRLSDMAVPHMASNLIVVSGTFVGAIVLAELAHINDDENILAASTLIELMHAIVVDIADAILTAAALEVARHETGFNYVEAGTVLIHGWALALVLSCITVPYFLFLIKPTLELFGQSTEVASITQEYFRGFAGGVPAILGLFINRHFLIGLEKPFIPFLMILFNTAISLGLGWAFTLGKLGFPKWDVFGMGVSYAFAAWPCFLLSTLYLLFTRDENLRQVLSKEMLKSLRSIPNLLKGIFDLTKTGFPLGISALSDFSLALTLSFSVGSLGSDYLIPQGIANEYILLLMTIVLSIGESISVLVKKAMPSHISLIKNYYFSGVLLSEFFVALGFVLFAAMPLPLFNLFCHGDCEGEANVALFQKIAFLGAGAMVFDSFRVTANGGLIGLNGGFATAVINAFSLMLLGVGAIVATISLSQQPEEEMILTMNSVRLLAVALGSLLMSLRWYHDYNSVVIEDYSRQVNADPTRKMSKMTFNCMQVFGGEYYQERNQQKKITLKDLREDLAEKAALLTPGDSSVNTSYTRSSPPVASSSRALGIS